MNHKLLKGQTQGEKKEKREETCRIRRYELYTDSDRLSCQHEFTNASRNYIQFIGRWMERERERICKVG